MFHICQYAFTSSYDSQTGLINLQNLKIFAETKDVTDFEEFFELVGVFREFHIKRQG